MKRHNQGGLLRVASSGTRKVDARPDLARIESLCTAWSESLADRSDDLLRLLTQIATRDSALAELDSAIAVLRGGRDEMRQFDGRPGGRVCTFLPSNNVLYSYVLFGLMPGLWSDEVLIRPSARTRSVLLALHEILKEFPRNPVTMVDASQREFVALCHEAEMVVFNGRYENLQRIRESIPGDIPVLGFGSGPNPIVVGPLSDIPGTVRAAVESRLFNGGQDCLCPDLLIAHASIYEEVRDQLSAAFDAIPRAPREQPGLIAPPMYYTDAFEAAASFIEAHREDVLTGGSIDRQDCWLEPTVVEFPLLSKTHPPELFSPVICLTGYQDVAEVRAWLGSETEAERGMYISVYGEPRLSDAVLGTSVNCGPRTSFDVEDGNQPFGGYGRRASARWQGDDVVARPLLLSREAGRGPAGDSVPARVAVR